jgi:hypothetical protein
MKSLLTLSALLPVVLLTAQNNINNVNVYTNINVNPVQTNVSVNYQQTASVYQNTDNNEEEQVQANDNNDGNTNLNPLSNYGAPATNDDANVQMMYGGENVQVVQQAVQQKVEVQKVSQNKQSSSSSSFSFSGGGAGAGKMKGSASVHSVKRSLSKLIVKQGRKRMAKRSGRKHRYFLDRCCNWK